MRLVRDLASVFLSWGNWRLLAEDVGCTPSENRVRSSMQGPPKKSLSGFPELRKAGIFARGIGATPFLSTGAHVYLARLALKPSMVDRVHSQEMGAIRCCLRE